MGRNVGSSLDNKLGNFLNLTIYVINCEDYAKYCCMAGGVLKESRCVSSLALSVFNSTHSSNKIKNPFRYCL